MKIIDILLLAAVCAAVGFSVYLMIRRRKNGGGCCGDCCRCGKEKNCRK